MEEFMPRYLTDFDEIKRLGKGADGVVFKCRHKVDKQEYAVKKKLFYHTLKDKAEGCREAEILALMSHPNVLRYYTSWMESSPAFKDSSSEEDCDSKEDCRAKEDCGPKEDFGSEEDCGSEDSDQSDHEPEFEEHKAQVPAKKWTLFIVTECCDSHLGDLLKEPISPAKALSLFTQIVEGLKHIQEKSVVHRDLKRDNIFLKEGQVKIGDFSLAKFLEDDYAPCTPNIGFGPYVAPEMKEGVVTKKSDNFTLGVLLYELFGDFRTDFERSLAFKKLQEEKKLTEFWEKKRSCLTPLLMDLICHEEARLSLADLCSEIQQLQGSQIMQEMIMTDM